MQRIAIEPRSNWQQTVESQGFLFHTPEGQPYWDESAYYQFTAGEIDQIERATYALDQMCQDAVQHVIDTNAFAAFQIPEAFWDVVKQSWDRDEITIYGRFDLGFDGNGEPKLLEYNADTPTSLLEASVIQWHWFQDMQSSGAFAAPAPSQRLGLGAISPADLPRTAVDQFNTIHERLIEAWQAVKADPSRPPGPMHFAALSGTIEDYMTVTYLRDTAIQAGWETEYLDVERIGWNWERRQFVDEQERPLANCFKLYPWEWMIRESFAPQLLEGRETTRWLEAPWKMILSNKAILPVLWELFPQSPYLLPASYQALDQPHVRKPMLGREGANVQEVVGTHVTLETEGPYEGPYVYQARYPIPAFDGNYPVVGSWMINGYAAGIGIREDETRITQNTSRFVPHVFG